jgi:hypothetical protein
MQDKMRRFMMGRYGSDDLNRFLLGLGIALLLLSTFFRYGIFEIIAFIILAISYYRMLSRNINQRYVENQKFITIKSRFFSYFQSLRFNSTKKRTHHIYACPTCKQKIRVPKGKGKICITCPKCHAEFIRKS